MQMLHPFVGSIQQYSEAISDPDRYRPDHCPQCQAQQPLTGHSFYCRTLVDRGFDGVIRVRRYLCLLCKRTVSLLPEFALQWLRFSITVISLFLALTYSVASRSPRPPWPLRRELCRISAASFGFAVSGARPSACAQRSPSWPLPQLRQPSSSGPCTCSNPPAGSPPTVSCSPTCGCTCWAGPLFSLQTVG
jgi:hypothetical protein